MKKSLFLLFLIFSTLLAIGNNFSYPLVAIPDGVDAGSVNPAGLGISRGFSLQFNVFNSDTSMENRGNIYTRFGNLSAGINWGDSDRNRHIAFGSRIFTGNYLLWGSTWRSDIAGNHYDLGLLSRPCSWFSLGAVWENMYSTNNNISSVLKAGIGIRPFLGNSRFTILGGIEYNDDIEFQDIPWAIGFQSEFIKGLKLNFLYDKNEKYSIGLETSFNYTSFGSSQNISEDNKITSGYSYLRIDSENQGSVISEPHRCYSVNLGLTYLEDPTTYLIFGDNGIRFFQLVDALSKGLEGKLPEHIFLNLNNYSLDWAQTEEVRNLILKYKDKGIEVFAYSRSYNDLSYYMATVADHIMLYKVGSLEINGLAVIVPFIKRALEKYDIGIDIVYEGDFKSASEIFTREDMSEYFREANSCILEDRINVYYSAISEGRNISVDSVKGMFDSIYINPEKALEAGLIDELIYEDELYDLLDLRGSSVAYNILNLSKISHREDAWTEKPKIALICADGGIIVGESGVNPIPIPFIGGKNMGSETIVRMIRAAKNDRSIRAVVMRVTSPGGSGLASDLIWREVELCSREKPFIISMGNVAGSGGYYISCAADRIFCDRNTITGSIGVISLKPVFGKMMENIGITFDTITTNPNALFYSTTFPMTEEQKEIFERENESFYRDFVYKVSQGRDMDYDTINSLAQGRIWSGDTAVKIGIVDEIGGLYEALNYTAEQINVENWNNIEVIVNPGSNLSIGIPFGEIYSLLNLDIIDIIEKENEKTLYDPYLEYIEIE